MEKREKIPTEKIATEQENPKLNAREELKKIRARQIENSKTDLTADAGLRLINIDALPENVINLFQKYLDKNFKAALEDIPDLRIKIEKLKGKEQENARQFINWIDNQITQSTVNEENEAFKGTDPGI